MQKSLFPGTYWVHAGTCVFGQFLRAGCAGAVWVRGGSLGSSMGAAAWVGTPFHDHARVSFAVKLGTPKANIKNADRRAWYQKLTLKQWQGISHQIDDSLRSRANQSLERLKGGGGDADLERRQMIEARIKAAEMVRQDIPKEHQTRRPFRSKLQQTILRKRRTMEAALREAVAKKGMSMLQLTCMHDLGITTSRNLSLQDQELLLDAP